MTLMRRRVVRYSLTAMTITLVACLALLLPKAHADTPPSTFSLEVSPSPMVITVQPGQTSVQQLQIRNNGTGTENLEIGARTFSVSDDSSQIELNYDTPPQIASWISYSAPTFSVQPGQIFTESIRLAIPQNAGFSYSFALVVGRQTNATIKQGSSLAGQVTIFVLMNVNKPGATSQVSVAQFSSAKRLYEYLPATLNVTLKNSGNTIVQPTGNIFIQRGAQTKVPLDTLTVNPKGNYILPGTSRTLPSVWSNGFPSYQTVTASNGKTKQQLVWNWAKLSDLRIGHYTAQLVAVYNNGQTDVPVQATLSFWVIPWKILLGVLVFVLLIGFGLWSIIRKITSPIRRRRKQRHFKSPKTP